MHPPVIHHQFSFLLVMRLFQALSLPFLSSGLRSRLSLSDISVSDTSNCTWTAWSECKLESDTRCARTRILEVLPLDKQLEDVAGKIPCNKNAGNVETAGCSDGLCPSWKIGEWTDCSGTCNSTMRPWEGYQRRDVTCEDISGVLYRADVCANLNGKDHTPEEERPCECSHKLKPYEPYAPRYTPVGV